MSAQPASTVAQPSHGHPDKSGSSLQPADKSATASHPSSFKPDPTIDADNNGPPRLFSASATASSSQLASLKMKLKNALRQYPDFPKAGILFEDILPIFEDPELHESLIKALEIYITDTYGESQKPDVVVGLEARGFLFGPSLALRLGAAFVPVRKQGKLPGETETASFKKEYGEDFFQMQKSAIKSGQRVIVVDDLIATGGSAAAAGQLIRKLGGELLGYIFLIELEFLKGRDVLDAPVYALLASQN